MNTKRVTIGKKPTPQNAEAWVGSREIEKPAVPMKRLTIDIPEDLHRAIKTACASRGTKIADEVRELLVSKYGNT